MDIGQSDQEWKIMDAFDTDRRNHKMCMNSLLVTVRWLTLQSQTPSLLRKSEIRLHLTNFYENPKLTYTAWSFAGIKFAFFTLYLWWILQNILQVKYKIYVFFYFVSLVNPSEYLKSKI